MGLLVADANGHFATRRKRVSVLRRSFRFTLHRSRCDSGAIWLGIKFATVLGQTGFLSMPGGYRPLSHNE